MSVVIGIDLEDEAFEQDVRELLMAFYQIGRASCRERVSSAG